MSITATDFAATLPGLRAQLQQAACRTRHCQAADGEDLVSETVRLALLILPKFDADPATAAALLAWLHKILAFVILRDQRAERTEVATVSVGGYSEELPAPPPRDPERDLHAAIWRLPPHLRDLVYDWLDGHSHKTLASAYRVHRNTIGSRLAKSFRLLRASVPFGVENGDVLDWLRSDFATASKVSIYRRPVGVWQSWRHTHPRDTNITLWGRRSAESYRGRQMDAPTRKRAA